MQKAFILGAGLGNRLRPLTNVLPKPLVPLFHQPLAHWAMDACARVGIQDFAINTHHLPDAWGNFHPPHRFTLFHEATLLETGGGLKNIAPWIGDDSILVHNGDIFSTMPLEKLIAAHHASGLPVTLALRSSGDARHIALDATGTRAIDIRHQLGTAPGTHLFSGIYCINPSLLARIPAHEKVSIIPAFLELAQAGQLGAIVLDEGAWLDLGDRASYLLAHRQLQLAAPIHPTAIIEKGAVIERSVIGPHAHIHAGAVLRDSVVWPGTTVAAATELDHCIVFSNQPATGSHHQADL